MTLKKSIPAFALLAAWMVAASYYPAQKKPPGPCSNLTVDEQYFLSKKVTTLSIDGDGHVSRTGKVDEAVDKGLQGGKIYTLQGSNFIAHEGTCLETPFTFQFGESDPTVSPDKTRAKILDSDILIFDFNRAAPKKNVPVYDGWLLLEMVDSSPGILMDSTIGGDYALPKIQLPVGAGAEIKKAGAFAVRVGPELDRLFQ